MKIKKLAVFLIFVANLAMFCISVPISFAMTANPDGPGAGYTTDEDNSFTTSNVLTNDTGTAPANLSVQSVDATSAAGALITDLGDGTFKYAPNGKFEYLAVGESTNDTFSYTAFDSGDSSTDTATVTIEVTGVNDGPTANDDSGAGYSTDEDGSFTTGNVLTNDTDPDQNGSPPDDVLSVSAVDAASAKGASITDLGDGTFTYDPSGSATLNALAAGETTTDTFSYTVSDGTATDTATVTIEVTGVNDGPTDISIDKNNVNENESIGAKVGTLSTTDVDSDTFTYTLVGGDTGSFAIDGSDLETAEVFNYEIKNSYTVTIRTTDSGGLWYEEAFTININDVNDAPTDISITNSSLEERSPSGTTVGTLSTTDQDAGDSHTYSLVAGSDSASFSISGDTLKTAAVFDYEDQNVYNITIRTKDSGNLTYDKGFTITVTDFQAKVSIVATTQASEDSTDGLFTLSTDKQFSTDTTINFTVTGNAASGTDYTSIGTNIVFPANTPAITIPVTVIADTVVELDETVIVTLTGTSDQPDIIVDTANDDATVTISNNDSASITINDVTQNEGNAGDTIFTFTVSMSTTSDAAVSVNYATAEGSATTADTDYAAASGTLNFAAGETSKTINVTVKGDTKVELDEGFVVNLSGLVNNGRNIAITDASGAGTITNDDSADITINDVTLAEGNAGDTTFTFTVNMSAISDAAVTLNYATADGTASVGDTDYTAATGILNFAAGDTSKTFNVTVKGDTKVENNENFYANLTLGTNNGRNITITDAQGIGTINNDDDFGFTIADSSNTEGSPVTFTVTMDAAREVSVDLKCTTVDGTGTIADNDYTAASATILTIPAGAAGDYTFNINTTTDAKVENNETFTVTVTSEHIAFDGANKTATGTINNDDKFGVTINNSSIVEGNPNTFTITITAARAIPVTVNYTTIDGTATVADNDYTAAVGTALTIPAGAVNQTAQFAISTTADSNDEDDETYTVTVTSADANWNGTIATGTGTIRDNDITITATAGANGTISPSGAVGVELGTDKTFIITSDTANNYYIVDSLTVDGTEISGYPAKSPATYTFTNVQGDHTIHAEFDDHGTGVCYDPTPDDGLANYLKCSPDPACDTATVLQFPSAEYVVNGNISAPGNRDFFKIIIPSGGGILSVYTTGTTDTHGTLLGFDCSIIATHDDINGTKDPNFRIIRDMPAGTYYIQVREGFDTGTGAYTLHATLEPDDHADTCDFDAHLLSCDGDSVMGEIKPAGDRDYFKLVLTETKLVKVWTTGNSDTYGVIYDDYCDEIVHNNDASSKEDNFYIETQLLGPYEGETERVYYISVRHYSPNELGSYTLNIECAEAFSINAFANFGGSISPRGIVIVGSGSSPSFDISANIGNTISNLLINGVPVSDVPTAFPDLSFTLTKNEGDTFWTFQFNSIDRDWSIQADFNVPPEDCVDISNVPLDSRIHAAPANIMVLLDDSQSMDWEIMTLEGGSTGVSAGQLTIGNKAYHYLYNLEDRVNKTGQGSNVLLNNDVRMYWKGQWQGHNKVYYKASVNYEPWPTKLNVDPNMPPSRPDEPGVVANMSEIYATYGDTSGIIIKDDADTANKAPYPFTKTGPWESATDGTAYGTSVDSYYWTAGPEMDPISNPADYTATWTPIGIPAGEYDVYARWVVSETRTMSEDVPYTITHSDGAGGTTTTEVSVNQTKNGGTWISLGTFTFNAGAGNVTVSLPNYDVTTGGTVSIDAVKFEPANMLGIEIPIAHYYTCEGTEEIEWGEDNQHIPITLGNKCTGQVWLVIIDQGEIRYFQFNDADTDGFVDDGELTEVAEASVPESVKTGRTYEEERQNFANWFTYYRKRDLLTRAAVSRVVTTLKGVNVGFRSLEGTLSIPVKPVKVGDYDESLSMLDEVYSYRLEDRGAATSSSPVRRALEDVGQYFDKTDGDEDGGIGPSPIASYEEGGGCQQNFVIMFSDAYYNGLPAGAMQDTDDTAGEFSGYPPYSDGQQNTLADIAMNYYMRDLAPDVEDEVPTNAFDSARHQHLVTYSVTFGVIGTLDPDDYDLKACEDQYKENFGAVPADSPAICPPWPTPVNSDTKKIDDLWHAAVNGRGEFHSANDVNELIEAFYAVLKNIEARIGSAASVSVNGDELYGILGEEVRMYQSSYSTDGWTGDVKAYKLDQETGEVITTTYEFSAAQALETKGWANRIIATYDGISLGIPFSTASLTDDQKALLMDGWEESGVTIDDILNFLRGDQSKTQTNGGSFRNRLQILGDIVHSSPQFKDNVLYTGGNDGLLHAFSAETGSEVFAYVPNLVFHNLNQLASPKYSHIPFVDLTPVVKDIDVTVDSEKVWTTILVGGLGKGGKGYYALDITGITNNSSLSEADLASRVLWEYPRSGTPAAEVDDMGFTFSRPSIVRSNDPGKPWVMITGNGYNSISSHAVLLVLDPFTGSLIKKIDTGIVVASGSQCNGLSTPIAIDPDSSGTVDYVYAGDLYGNVWKFNFTSTNYQDWGIAYGTDSSLDGQINYNGADEVPDAPKALFTARGPLMLPQPITTKPDVMKHCEEHGYMVVFGTGRYLGETDFLNFDVQSIYGIWDYGDDADSDEYVGVFQRSSSQRLSNQPETVTLLRQTEVPGDFTTASGQAVRILTNHVPVYSMVDDPDNPEGETATQMPDPGPPETCENELDDDGDGEMDENDECLSHAGWYVDVPPGERVANDLMIREGKIVMIGFVPEQTPCGTGGISIVMELDACTGGRLELPQFDITGDLVIDTRDLINIGTEDSPEWVAPTGIVYDGRLMPPAILRVEDEEIKYFSTNVGSIVTLREKAVSLGITYWKEVD